MNFTLIIPTSELISTIKLHEIQHSFNFKQISVEFIDCSFNTYFRISKLKYLFSITINYKFNSSYELPTELILHEKFKC